MLLIENDKDSMPCLTDLMHINSQPSVSTWWAQAQSIFRCLTLR